MITRAEVTRVERQVEAKLVVVGGKTKAPQYDLRLPTVIGRSRRTDLILGHPLVSRQHCEVFEAEGLLMVRDLGSLNGTFLGETRIAEQAVPVKPGDLLTIGPVTFRAVYRASGKYAHDVDWDSTRQTLDAPLPGQIDEIKDTPNRSRLQSDEDDAPPGAVDA